MPSHSHSAHKHAVAAWIPLAHWLALRAGAALLGVPLSDLVAKCIERCAADVIREEKERREERARRLVARNDNHTGGTTQC
jgi:hypothetical protein